MLTQKRLKEVLKYNSKTGIFTWRIKLNQSIIVNSIAGSKSKKGYIVIRIERKLYKAHRLAWLYVYGYFPENDIDHKNRIKYHNWIDNLREASGQCNARNTGNSKRNTSGVKGVSWLKSSDKWCVRITINNKNNKYLGLFEDFDEAVCARLAAEQCVNWEGCDSSSPAYKYVKENILC